MTVNEIRNLLEHALKANFILRSVLSEDSGSQIEKIEKNAGILPISTD